MLCFGAIEECSLVCQEELFTTGKVGEKVYFVSGGVMVYKRVGFEDEEVSSGQWAAEAVLWIRWTHCGTFRAQTSCEAFYMHAERAREIMLKDAASVSFAAQYAQIFWNVLVERNRWTDIWSEHDCESIAKKACGIEDKPRPQLSRSASTRLFHQKEHTRCVLIAVRPQLALLCKLRAGFPIQLRMTSRDTIQNHVSRHSRRYISGQGNQLFCKRS